MNTLKMSGKEIVKKSSLDYLQRNEADIVERSNSDRTYNPYDYAILQRLQFLTQRVEYLENKLENSLTSQHEDLNFGLSVNNRDNIPNIDIKVLSGNKYDGEQIMDGWEDAVVERNTSFLIIPVGESQEVSADPNMIKQTFDLSLTPSLSPRPALSCSDTYENAIEDNKAESVEQECKQTNSISLQINPPPVKTFAQSSKQSACYSIENDTDAKDDFWGVFTKHHAELSQNQETNKQEKSVSKLTATPQKDSNKNYLKYGYTIRATKSPASENDSSYYSPEDSNKIKIDSGNSVSSVDKLDGSHRTRNTPNNRGTYTNNQSRDDSICYQDVEICEVAQYEDKIDDNFDRTVDIKIQRRISKENCVYLPTRSNEPMSKQYKNRRNSESGRDIISDRFRNERETKRDESESDSLYSNDLKPNKVHFEQIRTKLQIYESKSQPYRGDHCIEDESDGRLILVNKGTPMGRLTHNNSQHNSGHNNVMDLYVNNNTSTQKESKNDSLNKPTIKKVRVRSVEIPSTTSSDDDLLSISSASELSARYQRPQRSKPKKPAKSYDIENRRQVYIDPKQIGNVHEQIKASQRPLLLNTMSPTESGCVGSNTNSPSNDWRNTSLTSVSTYESTSSRPDSPCSSMASYTTPVRSQSSSKGRAHYSTGSSLSDDVFINKPDKRINDSSFSIGNTRLNEVLPGPTRLSLNDYSPTQFQLSEFLSDERSIASTEESVVTSDLSDLSDSFLECQDECCQCQTGISTEDDFREELKSISRHVIEAGEKSSGKKKSSPLRRLFLDEEQGEMDTFGSRLQVGDNKAVPLLVKVILRLRKHFFDGLKGPFSLKSLTPVQKKQFTFPEKNINGKKISFSPDAMLLSAVGESSPSEIRDIMERVRVDVNKLSPSGKSLLHKAAASGNLESIYTLIQYGAKVNLPDENGFVPVHAALRRCHYKCAIFLIECGTDMTLYTGARIQEIAEINNMARAHKKTVLNTAL